MFTRQLSTRDPIVNLVKPDIQRDAALGVSWLADDPGRKTLKLMGVADESNRATTLAEERKRVSDFLTNTDHYNWMISVGGRVVGGVWADLKPTEYIEAPTISIMLGDPGDRGKGIGKLAMQAVIDYLSEEAGTVYARHLIENASSKALLASVGFKPYGDSYTDKDGLRWQNVKRGNK